MAKKKKEKKGKPTIIVAEQGDKMIVVKGSSKILYSSKEEDIKWILPEISATQYELFENYYVKPGLDIMGEYFYRDHELKKGVGVTVDVLFIKGDFVIEKTSSFELKKIDLSSDRTLLYLSGMHKAFFYRR